jgi:glycosyltransferase involved in cell wall biosynthesis
MRVVHLHRMGGIGGSERHLLALLPALRELGVTPIFVGLDDRSREPQPFYDALDAEEIRYVRLPSPRDLDPELAASLRGTLRTIRPDLVHTHLVHADVYGSLATPIGTPLVSTKHNDDRFRAGPFRHVERMLVRRARRVIAITEALRRFSVEEVGLPARKVEVVHYGLDELPEPWAEDGEPQLPDGARLLLAVARLDEQKGVDVAIRALAQVRKEHPDAVLAVLGEGPARAELEALARSVGVGDALLLPGRVGDVAAWYRRAELLVHPARWEGFGLALLEAMLAGLPVVASAVSSVPEIVVDGETGLLVPPDDAAALAAALSSLLADRERAAALGAAGLARARAEFSVERMARKTLAVYERAS